MSTIQLLVLALIAPWMLARRVRNLSPAWPVAIASFSILTAAILSTVLSTWTYLAGKGLLLARFNEMDLGQDDLPPDTAAQVINGLIGAAGVWVLLLAIALIVCVAVADTVYRRDRDSFRLAVRLAGVVSVWFVVWAVAILAANSVREQSVGHPARAIRAYAQLNQKGFRGSSAMAPGAPERQPLNAAGRFTPVAILFPLIWSAGLPAARGRRARLVTVGAAVLLSWLAWWAVWRLLPWITITAMAG